LLADGRMPDRVDPAVKGSEPSGCYTPAYRPPRHPTREQLLRSHHPGLPTCQFADEPVHPVWAVFSTVCVLNPAHTPRLAATV
jgi:hypothetical protein